MSLRNIETYPSIIVEYNHFSVGRRPPLMLFIDDRSQPNVMSLVNGEIYLLAILRRTLLKLLTIFYTIIYPFENLQYPFHTRCKNISIFFQWNYVSVEENKNNPIYCTLTSTNAQPSNNYIPNSRKR